MPLQVGGVLSVDAVTATSPECRVAGCAFMSASRFTVACWIAGSGVVVPSLRLPYRCLSKDYEHTREASEGLIRIAAVITCCKGYGQKGDLTANASGSKDPKKLPRN